MSTQFRLERLLIVEDQQLVRAGIKAMLRMALPNCEVVEAGSFEEATAQLKLQPFDFAFLDIDLRAEKSGLDVLDFIQRHDLYCRVVMLSGKDDRETVLACINAGACGYIAKGVGDESVFEAALATVPRQFTLTPRNPEKRVTMGGDHLVFGLVAGPPHRILAVLIVKRMPRRRAPKPRAPPRAWGSRHACAKCSTTCARACPTSRSRA